MKDLTFPENIVLEPETLPGILRKDLRKLITLALPGVAVGVCVWVAGDGSPLMQLIAMMAMLAWLFVCYVIMVRLDGSLSIYNYISLMLRFLKEQQRFKYNQPKEALYVFAATRPEAADSAGIYER